MADAPDEPSAADLALDDNRRGDAQLVERWRSGDERAYAELYDKWFDRVHDLALRIVRNPETAAEVAQDAFLTAWQKIDTLGQPASFGGWLLRIARNRALNRSDREKRSSAVSDETMALIERDGPTMSAPAGFAVEDRLARAADPQLAAEDNEVAALLWSAADALGERDRTVLTLQLRYGMSPAEVGDVLGVNRNAANQMVHRVKGRLDVAVQSRVLWDGDRPSCDGLVAALEAKGITEFGPDAVKVTEQHVKTCDECGDRRRLRLQPAALFGALPILVAPQLLKQKVAAALAGEGVPVDPARYASSGSTEPSEGRGEVGEVDDVGDGETGGDAASDPTSGRGLLSSGRNQMLVGAALLVVVAIVAATLLLAPGDDDGEVVLADAAGEADGEGDDEEEASDAPADSTATSAPASSGTAAEGTAPPSSQAVAPGPAPPALVLPEPDPGDAPDNSGNDVTPTPDPVPPTNPIDEFTLTPSTKTGSFYALPDAPRLRWSVQPGWLVSVSGPGLPTTTAPSGDVAICPDPPLPSWTSCSSAPGTFTYRIEVRRAITVLFSGEQTLTITP
jgi:RNA polymerase sigma factor (sigma-70 family)